MESYTTKEIKETLEKMIIDSELHTSPFCGKSNSKTMSHMRQVSQEAQREYRKYRKQFLEECVNRWKDIKISILENSGHSSDVINPESLTDENTPTQYYQNFFLSYDNEDVKTSNFMGFAKKCNQSEIFNNLNNPFGDQDRPFGINFYTDDMVKASNGRMIYCNECIRILLVDGEEEEYIRFYNSVLSKLLDMFKDKLNGDNIVISERAKFENSKDYI